MSPKAGPPWVVGLSAFVVNVPATGSNSHVCCETLSIVDVS
jgi:hypothetical protein